MELTPFFQVHKDLPREGPGTAADVAWAIGVAGTGGAARVCDAGCGPGADTEALAGMLPEARIDAVDLHGPFAEAAAARCARFGPRVSVRHGSMADLEGPYDLIWCAGALYFLGVSEGLAAWRTALSGVGRVAFSEPVLLGGPEPAAVRAFWEEYPGITGRDGIAARVAAAGYTILGERQIIGQPWADYYEPMQARIDALRGGDPSEALTAALDAAQQEIDGWRAASDRIAYLLLVVAPE